MLETSQTQNNLTLWRRRQTEQSWNVTKGLKGLTASTMAFYFGSPAASTTPKAKVYWCGYLYSGKASFALTPDGRHAVIQVGSPLKEHLDRMRTDLLVNGELEEVHTRRSDVKWKLTFTNDTDTHRVCKVALLPGAPENEDARMIYEAVFGHR